MGHLFFPNELSEDERQKIDARVHKNHRQLKLATTKMWLIFSLLQPLSPVAMAISLPLIPPTGRLVPNLGLVEKGSYSPKFSSLFPSIVEKGELDDQQIDMVDQIWDQLQSGSITVDEAILKLRGGSDLSMAILALIGMVFLWWSGALAFNPSPAITGPPPQSSTEWGPATTPKTQPPHGKCTPTQRCFTIGPTGGLYDLEFQRDVPMTVHHMTAANENMTLIDEDGFFRSEKEANKYLTDRLGPSTDPIYYRVNSECKITDWQMVKKLKHSKVDPKQYGTTDEMVKRIDKLGIGKYVRSGNDLPSPEHIEAAQKAIVDFCHQPDVEKKYIDVSGEDALLDNVNENCTLFINRKHGELPCLEPVTMI